MSKLWDLTGIQPITTTVLEGATLPAMFWTAVEQRADQVWMRHKDLGIWRSWSWAQSGAIVREIACGLIELGLQPRDTASILSNTSAEWVWADLAVLSCGGVCNGIYPTDAAS
ncbi:MAG: Long-chain-fatty-acid--CoA ligase FadD15, partial [Ramlibacter sp.]|nr:Long-chain-fatty-acid--CoA ligase FadD15 [Ramlibacter sp.]